MGLKGESLHLIGCPVHVGHDQVIDNVHRIGKALPRITEALANATELSMVEHYHFL